MNRLTTNTIANLIGKGWAALANIVFVPVYIRFLGIEAYGLIGFYATLQALVYLLDMGLSTTLNREMARLSARPDTAQEMRDLLRTLEIIYWVVALAIALLVVALAPLIAGHWIHARSLPAGTIVGAVRVMGLVMALQFPYALYEGGLLGLQRQVLLNAIQVTMATFRAAGVVVVLWLVSRTIEAYFTWQIVFWAAQTLAAALCLHFCIARTARRPRFRADLLAPLWRFAAGIAGISTLGAILTQQDKLILSKMLPLDRFGYYSLAALVAGGLYMIINPVFTAVFPRFSQAVATQTVAEQSALYHRTAQFMSVLLLPAVVVVALFAPEIILSWTRNPVTVQNTHVLVTILVIGTGLHGLVHIPYALQLAHGWTRLALAVNLVSVVVLFPLIIIMARRYGAEGAASVWVLLNGGYALISVQIMHRRYLRGEQWRWYAQDVGAPLVAALAVAFAARWLMHGTSTVPVMLCSLAAVYVTALAGAILAAPDVRAWVLLRLTATRTVLSAARG